MYVLLQPSYGVNLTWKIISTYGDGYRQSASKVVLPEPGSLGDSPGTGKSDCGSLWAIDNRLLPSVLVENALPGHHLVGEETAEAL